MSSWVVIVVLFFSVIIHEVGHGLAALFFGDTTARDQGRLTLNPLVHIDPLGSVIVPMILSLVHSPFLFGWARPVPFREENLHPRRLGILCVTLAGITVNITVAVVCGLILRFTYAGSLGNATPLFQLLALITFINLLLGMFNLIPIPPLDGHRLITVWLSEKWRMHVERYGFFFIPILIFLLTKISITKPVLVLFTWLTKISIQL